MMNHVFQFRSYKEFIILSLTALSMQSFGTKMMNCVYLTITTGENFSIGQETKCVLFNDDTLRPCGAREQTNMNIFAIETY